MPSDAYLFRDHRGDDLVTYLQTPQGTGIDQHLLQRMLGTLRLRPMRPIEDYPLAGIHQESLDTSKIDVQNRRIEEEGLVDSIFQLCDHLCLELLLLYFACLLRLCVRSMAWPKRSKCLGPGCQIRQTWSLCWVTMRSGRQTTPPRTNSGEVIGAGGRRRYRTREHVPPPIALSYRDALPCERLGLRPR